jgi:hypothetical protein
MNKHIKRELTDKFIADIYSVKVWILFLASVFLIKGYLTGTHWISAVTAILSLRSFDSYSFSQTIQKVEDKKIEGE